MTITFPVATASPAGLIKSTDWNNLRDSIGYLLNRPSQSIILDHGADYTNNVIGWADIDATSLKITLANKGSLVYVYFSGVVLSAASSGVFFDFTLNGARVGAAGANGLAGVSASGATTTKTTLSFGSFVAVSPGSNVFKVQWNPQTAAVMTLFGGAGVSPTDYMIQFAAVEVA